MKICYQDNVQSSGLKQQIGKIPAAKKNDYIYSALMLAASEPSLIYPCYITMLFQVQVLCGVK
jgi:hypothetical protein